MPVVPRLVLVIVVSGRRQQQLMWRQKLMRIVLLSSFDADAMTAAAAVSLCQAINSRRDSRRGHTCTHTQKL